MKAITKNILNAGLADQSFYDEYDKKTEVEQQIFVDEYIGGRINADETYQAGLNEYREAATIVPVVMDFGVLQLRTAESMDTQADRNTELKAAEKTFLSIKNIVGDTDDYKIYLGQVYFWLGKQDEGQALFDEILTKNSRDSNSLLSIASTLRNLGKVGLATELTQEAYDSAKDDQTRYNAAGFMQLLSNTNEDKIKWLERADPKSVYVQASLKDNQGHLAAQKGDKVKAARYYRQAIGHSESLAENASNYNNTALMYFSLHQVTGDKTAYQKGVDLMSKAVELQPDSSILLSNSASTLVINSLYETLDDDIDYLSLQNQPSMNNLGYHYADMSGKNVIRDKVKPHKDFNKALEYFERSILLSPNNFQNYHELYGLLYFLNDREAIAGLADKMVQNKVDISASKTRYIDYINGVDSDEDITKLKSREKYYRDLLSNNTFNKATLGVLHDMLAENLLTQVRYNEFGAAQRAVTHAEKAVLNLKSSETKTTLTNALLTLASVQALDSQPSYKALRDKSGKNLLDTTLVVLSLNQDNELAKWFRENPNVKRAINMEVAEFKHFPENPSPENWALVRTVNSELAASVGAQISGSKYRESMQRIAEISMPISGETIANRCVL